MLFWIFLILFTVIDIYLAAVPWQEIRDTIGWVKNIPQSTNFKLRHIVQYTPQVLVLAYFSQSLFKNRLRVVCYNVLIVTVLGILTEVVQYFTPSRIPSLLDIFWNTFAAVLGGVIFFYSKKKSNP
jgi:VanZ family protein